MLENLMARIVKDAILPMDDIHPVSIIVADHIITDTRWTANGPQTVGIHNGRRFVISVSERDFDRILSALWTVDVDAYSTVGDNSHIFVNIA